MQSLPNRPWADDALFCCRYSTCSLTNGIGHSWKSTRRKSGFLYFTWKIEDAENVQLAVMSPVYYNYKIHTRKNLKEVKI